MKVTIKQSKKNGVEEIEMKIEKYVEDENTFTTEIVEDEKIINKMKSLKINYFIVSSLKILKYILIYI